MTPEQQDKVRQKIELIRRKVRNIFDLLDEIEKELGYGGLARGYYTQASDRHSNVVDTGSHGEEKEEERVGAENSTSGYHS